MRYLVQDLSVPVVAIDGGPGTRKRQVAQIVARRLGFNHFSSGLLYRAVGWQAMNVDCSKRDVRIIVALALSLDVRMEGDRVLLHGRDVTDQLLSDEGCRLARVMSSVPELRKELELAQVRMRRHPGLAIDGRDAGAIFDTPHRFFFTASPESRAQRRIEALRARGERAEYGFVLKGICLRAEADAIHPINPLRKHPDARAIDTTDREPEDIAEEVLSISQLQLSPTSKA